jgi:signal transduction histidine kinase
MISFVIDRPIPMPPVARARATGGIGIGLSITKEIIDRHKGRIEVESEENVGTTFRIIVPLA